MTVEHGYSDSGEPGGQEDFALDKSKAGGDGSYPGKQESARLADCKLNILLLLQTIPPRQFESLSPSWWVVAEFSDSRTL